jgi:hypothetical protein
MLLTGSIVRRFLMKVIINVYENKEAVSLTVEGKNRVMTTVFHLTSSKTDIKKYEVMEESFLAEIAQMILNEME